MTEEEKGFIIKDRRSFDEKGELKEEAVKAEKEQEKAREESPKKEGRTAPLPEANFNSLIFSLSSTALLHIGEIPDPMTGKKKVDLPMARHAIDTIHMLKEKTAGNLNDEERKFIDTILTDLQWRYVKASK